MNVRKNLFKRNLKEGTRQYGIWNGIPHTMIGEICAAAGFDFICIDAEHGPFNVPSALLQLQAMEPYNVSALVRVPTGDPVLIKQYLDIGAQSLIVPMIESADQARLMVKAMNYPPKGIRGIGSGLARAARWNKVDNYFRDADEENCLILQIESIEGLDNLDEIVEVEGVHGILLGPSDLAGSMGYLGNPSHPEVVSTVVSTIKKIHQSGMPAGFLTLGEDLIQKYTDSGATMIAVGVDTLLLSKAAEALAKKYKGAEESNL